MIVEHAVYGQLIGQLQIRSRFDVDAFVEKLNQYRAAPLLIADGGHSPAYAELPV